MFHINIEPPDCVILSHPRSGTHFLLSCLSSHSRVHGRGECFLQWARCNMSVGNWIYQNRPERLNIAIVMYSTVRIFESLCGPLTHVPLIHLKRDPFAVALSNAQLQADTKHFGPHSLRHRRISDPVIIHPPISRKCVRRLKLRISTQQTLYTRLLCEHNNMFDLTYEEMTNQKQASGLPDDLGMRLMKFLCLPYEPLRTTLAKTAPERYEFID